MSKLTADQVRAIYRIYAEGSITQTKLAASYGVSRQLISRIVRGKRWGHLSGHEVAQAANF